MFHSDVSRLNLRLNLQSSKFRICELIIFDTFTRKFTFFVEVDGSDSKFSFLV